MTYETRPSILSDMTAEQWDDQLARAMVSATVPRRIIRISDDRRTIINRMLSNGMTQVDIARSLNVSPGLINKIIKGERR